MTTSKNKDVETIGDETNNAQLKNNLKRQKKNAYSFSSPNYLPSVCRFDF